MPKELPPPEVLRKILRYDAETGNLYWRTRPVEFFPTRAAASRWNGRYAGTEAFAKIERQGYKVGSVFSALYKAHRVIWAIEFGHWPPEYVDHIDMDKTNNVLSNLRLATRQQNRANTRANGNSLSGVKGVYRHSDNVRWRAQIAVSGVKKHLGLFADIEDAKAAYARAIFEAYGEFGRAV